MRKLYVPITVDPGQNRDQYLKDFKDLGVDHVFLSCGERWPLVSEETRNKWMDLIEEANAFYTKNGYECGVWISTIGYGGALFSDATDTGDRTQIRAIVGKNGGDALCPSNDTFVDSIAKTVQEIATECGVQDVNYFIKLFKRQTGMTPSRFRALQTRPNTFDGR